MKPWRKPTGLAVILGPCRCQGCGAEVWWMGREGLFCWRHWRGKPHHCGTIG